jgi:hypothetical protein
MGREIRLVFVNGAGRITGDVIVSDREADVVMSSM